MSRRSMYFGTRDRMAWVACPAVERDSGAVGWSESGTYLNGGAFVARSKGSHRVHEMAWNMVSRKEAGLIESFASGVYGAGPYYWIDPMAADHNVLPTNWAYPAQELDTGIPLTDSTLGTFVATPAGNDSLPLKSMQYVLPTGSVGKKMWVPIPPGHTLHFGAYGSTSGSGTVFATPYGRNGATGSRVPTQLADPSGNVWATSSWSGDVYAGVEFDVGSSGTPVRNLVTNPAMVATSGTVEVRRNEILNPQPASTSNWTPAGATLTPSTSADGVNQLEVLHDGETSNCYVRPSVAVSSVQGTWAAFAVDVMPLSQWDADNMRLTLGTGSVASYSRPVPMGTFTRISAAHYIDSTGETLRPYVWPSNTAGARAGFIIRRASVAIGGSEQDALAQAQEYFDGSTASPDPDLTASWEGSVNASASVLTGAGVANLSSAGTTWTTHPYQITEPDGSKAARFKVVGSSAMRIPISDSLALTPGEMYTMMFEVRSDRALTNVSPRIQNSTGAPLLDVPADQWTPVRLTAEAGTSTWPNTGIYLNSNAGQIPGTFIDIRNAMLTEGEYFGDYRDGNSAGWAWEGPANSSTSTEVGAAVTLSGMVAQVLPNGRTPLATGWLDGLGTSGAEFEEHPERTDYSSIMDKVGLTATLVEVGTWL